MDREAALRRYRLAMAAFIAGLVVSGLTAFPLLTELRLLERLLGVAPDAPPAAYAGLRFWIATVGAGLERTYAAYPWVAYGTDWLAFAHVAIAVFFIGPLVDPVRNKWVVQSGLIACALVVPLALVAGPIRGIPLYWRLIDCSFGVLGALPLWYCLRLTRALEADRD
ncbi:MAG: hypothetical protein HY079_07200 [Elusimicrobia bacterium]|nr:hypothetical protein [Elusimicrobiota bacterium]